MKVKLNGKEDLAILNMCQLGAINRYDDVVPWVVLQDNQCHLAFDYWMTRKRAVSNSRL